MALIYLTGIAGSGKSTALNELQRRGYEVYDADEHLSYWSHKSTGAKVDASDHTLTTDPEFFERHDWYIDKEGVADLAEKAHERNKTIFICGSVVNENEVWGYFDRVICLHVDNEILAERLRNRIEKDFGKAEHELAHVLKLNSQVKAKYDALDCVIIDSNQPKEKIADEIISYLE